RSRHQAAGARLGRGDGELSRAAKVEHPLRGGTHLVINHGALHGRRMVAVAMATRPSRRPVNPIFSLVGALTATRSGGIPAIAAMRSRMASRCGPTRGASHTMVTSQFTTRPPRARTRAQAKARKRSDEAPRHCGSLGGKW